MVPGSVATQPKTLTSNAITSCSLSSNEQRALYCFIVSSTLPPKIEILSASLAGGSVGTARSGCAAAARWRGGRPGVLRGMMFSEIDEGALPTAVAPFFWRYRSFRGCGIDGILHQIAFLGRSRGIVRPPRLVFPSSTGSNPAATITPSQHDKRNR